ncbi:MAG: hypothetical protein ACYCW6_23385, partial [Candidatus Xenobia bacterium]
LKSHPATANIPVVIVSVVDEPNRGLILGATDYLLKPVSRDALLASVEVLGVPLQRVAGLRILLVGDADELDEIETCLRNAGCEVRRLTTLGDEDLPGDPEVHLALLNGQDTDEIREVAATHSIPILTLVDADSPRNAASSDIVRCLLRSDARRADRLIRAVRQAVDQDQFGGSRWHTPTGLASESVMLAELQKCIDSAQRTGQRVALIVVRAFLPSEAPVEPWLGLMRPHLREGDLVGVAGDNVVSLVVPGIGPEVAEAMGKRFREVLQSCTGINAGCTVTVCYPHDGTTADELRTRALQRLLELK